MVAGVTLLDSPKPEIYTYVDGHIVVSSGLIYGLDNEAHRNYLREVYGHHGHGSLKQFEYFYEAQCVWEDTMAQNIADFLIKEEGKMIVFTGNGHIVNKYGIPDRAVKRHPVSMVTVMPYAIHGTEEIEKGMADYVWLTPSYPHRRRSSI